MDYETILGSAVIVAILSGLVSYIISKKQSSLQYITGERKEWRESIRVIASRLLNASYYDTLKLLTELKVRINAYGNQIDNRYSHDSHIWELIKEMASKDLSYEELKCKQNQMIEYLSLLLKSDWERSKIEVKGNTYNNASYLLYFISFVCYTFLNYMCLSDSTDAIELIAKPFIPITITIIINILTSFSVKTFCADFLSGKYEQHIKKHRIPTLIKCFGVNILDYILCMLIYFIFTIIFSPSIFKEKTNIFMILLLFLLYALGLGFQFVSQFTYCYNESLYIDSINEIRSNYKNNVTSTVPSTINIVITLSDKG